MKTICLTLRSRDDGAERIAELVWESGTTRVVDAVTAIADDLHRLIAVGLVEWIGSPVARERRHTLSSDAAFLDRLGDYFGRQSGFLVKIVERQVSDAVLVKKLSKQPPRGAIYIVSRTHQPEAIAMSMQRATHLQANPVLRTHLGPSASQRRAVYRELFEAKADSGERN